PRELANDDTTFGRLRRTLSSKVVLYSTLKPSLNCAQNARISPAFCGGVMKSMAGNDCRSPRAFPHRPGLLHYCAYLSPPRPPLPTWSPLRSTFINLGGGAVFPVATYYPSFI